MAEVPLVAKVWYLAAVSFDRSTGDAKLWQVGVVNRYNSHIGPVVPFDYGSRVSEKLRVKPVAPATDVPFLWAAASEENDMRGRFAGDSLQRQDRSRRCRGYRTERRRG